VELSKTIRKADKSTAYYFLRSRILHWLNRADREGNPKKRFECLEKARDLSRQLRQKDQGFTKWWSAISFAAVILAGLLYAAHVQSERTYRYSAPDDVFQILYRADAYHYSFRHVHSENGIFKYAETIPATFCPNYEPQLSAGQTLTALSYMDLGKCWNIEPKGFGYSFETTDGVHPTLAPNCHAGKEIYVCEPNPTEARF
jgi:hypothetical protein